MVLMEKQVWPAQDLLRLFDLIEPEALGADGLSINFSSCANFTKFNS